MTEQATRAYKAHYPACEWCLFSNRAPHIHLLPQFCNDSAHCLVWRRARFKVNFLNDDTYRYDCATIFVHPSDK